MPLARLAPLLLLLAACHSDRPPADVTDATGVSTAGAFADDAAPPASGAGALRDSLDAAFSPDRTLGYDAARDALYAWEQRTEGALCDVYAGWCAALPPGDPSKAADRLGLNCEHTWPQSYGARDEPLRSDLHHLFPVLGVVNASRGNLPLADVPDAAAEAWYRDAASQSNTPSEPGAWSQRGMGRFEPRDAHKGDAARALFYVATVYPEVLGGDGAAFFETMRADLLAWNRTDPPDDHERARDTWIARLQGTRNPFVEEPGLADRAFGSGAVRTPARSARAADRAPAPPRASASGPPAEPGGLWLSALHYDNAGEDTGEGVGVSGPDGARLGGASLVLYNGAGGRVVRTVALSGRVPLWVPVPGLQNGPADGVALVRPDGSVADFVSWEGALAATDGPAAGRTARETDVAEGSDTPVGHALTRAGPGAPWRLGPASAGRR